MVDSVSIPLPLNNPLQNNTDIQGFDEILTRNLPPPSTLPSGNNPEGSAIDRNGEILPAQVTRIDIGGPTTPGIELGEQPSEPIVEGTPVDLPGPSAGIDRDPQTPVPPGTLEDL